MKLTFKLIAITILVALSTARKLRRREDVGCGENHFTACVLSDDGKNCSDEKLSEDTKTCLFAFSPFNCLKVGVEYKFQSIKIGTISTQLLDKENIKYKKKSFAIYFFYYDLACHTGEKFADFKDQDKVVRITFSTNIQEIQNFKPKSVCVFSR